MLGNPSCLIKFYKIITNFFYFLELLSNKIKYYERKTHHVVNYDESSFYNNFT